MLGVASARVAVVAACVSVSCAGILWAGPPAQACIGDCNTSGTVTVDELLVGVSIALGNAPIDECTRLDSNGDGLATIDELLAAVHAAIDGCPANQTPLVSCFGIYRTYPGFEIRLPIDATDPDDDPLQYTAADLPEGAVLDATSGVFTWTPTAQQIGAFYVPFTVTDSGAPPLSTEGVLTFRVAPTDLCVQPTCSPATGCEAEALPLSQPCCIDLPPRLVEPTAPCPEGRVLFIGRNVLGGVGRLSNCDRLAVFNSGQTSAVVRLNLETRCLDTDLPVTVQARIVTQTRVVFDAETSVVLQPRADGYAQVLGLTFPVETPGPFFDLDEADADLTVTVTDQQAAAVSAQVRPTLTFRRPDDLEDFDAPPPDSLGTCE